VVNGGSAGERISLEEVFSSKSFDFVPLEFRRSNALLLLVSADEDVVDSFTVAVENRRCELLYGLLKKNKCLTCSFVSILIVVLHNTESGLSKEHRLPTVGDFDAETLFITAARRNQARGMADIISSATPAAPPLPLDM
jgi:hypothetical protein